MTFVKGQSGNPRGRVPNAPELTPAIRKLLAAPWGEGKTGRDRLATALLDRAYNGDIAAIQVVLDRVDGKLATSLEHAGPGGGPVGISVRVTYIDETIGHGV